MRLRDRAQRVCTVSTYHEVAVIITGLPTTFGCELLSSAFCASCPPTRVHPGKAICSLSPTHTSLLRPPTNPKPHSPRATASMKPSGTPYSEPALIQLRSQFILHTIAHPMLDAMLGIERCEDEQEGPAVPQKLGETQGARESY